MIKELDGPRLEPRGRAPSALVVLLHGYGANGDDLIALGEEWRRRLPGCGIRRTQRAADDPRHARRAAMVRAHHARSRRVLARRGRRAPASRPVPRWGARPLPAGRRSPRAGGLQPGHHDGPARWACGARPGRRRSSASRASSPGPEHLTEITARPPILLIHGEADDLIPAEALHIAREPLAHAGLPVEWHVRPGLGHGIDPGGIAMAGHFMAHVLRG